MKRFLILLLITMMLVMFGCGDKNVPTDSFNGSEATEDNSPSDIGPSNGYSTENELIEVFLKCLNNGKLTDEFYAAYDYAGLVAFWIMDNTSNISFHEAYLAISDLELGANYISKHHPDFVRKYNENYEEQFGDELVNKWLQTEAETRDKYDDYLKKLSESYAPIDETVDESEIWHSDNGYSTYDVLVVYSREEGSVSVGLRYIAIDGEYRWIMINETLGGYGG